MAVDKGRKNLDEILAKLTALQERSRTMIDKQNGNIEVFMNSTKDLTCELQNWDAKVDQFHQKNPDSFSPLQHPARDSPNSIKKLKIQLQNLDEKVDPSIHTQNLKLEPQEQSISYPNLQQQWSNPAPEIGNQLQLMRLAIPRFSGKNLSSWITSTQRYFNFYNIPDHRRLLIASFYLDGQAFDWYNCLRNSRSIPCWKDFLLALGDRFQSSEYEVTMGNMYKPLELGPSGDPQLFDELSKQNIGVLEPVVESFNVDSDSSVSARNFDKNWQTEKESLERKNPKETNSKTKEVVFKRLYLGSNYSQYSAEDINGFMEGSNMLTILVADMLSGSEYLEQKIEEYIQDFVKEYEIMDQETIGAAAMGFRGDGNFFEILYVDEVGLRIVWVKLITKETPCLNRMGQVLGLIRRYSGRKALHDGSTPQLHIHSLDGIHRRSAKFKEGQWCYNCHFVSNLLQVRA